MGVTALKIGETRLLLMTVPKEDGGVDVDIYMANEDFYPEGKSSVGYAQQNEEEYHKELRFKSHERGHFISEFSTNPEWNPDWTPAVIEEDGEQSQVQ